MNEFQKLDYILSKYMTATQVTTAFGFKSETMLTKMRNGKSNINKLHIDGLERYFNIPTEIFEKKLNEKDEIDTIIKAYQLQKKEEKRKALKKKKVLVQLEEQGLIPKNIFDNVELDEEEIGYLTKQHKKHLGISNSSASYIEHSKKVFPDNEKLFQKLKGIWYGYVYPSNPASAQHGVWEVKTIIHDDYSVVDEPWANRGYIKLGKHESMIIKESYDNDDLTFIRFSNRQVPSKHFRFVIVSNQNNTHNEMVNFGFFSRKQYSPDEAKEILGNLESKQLKLDTAFNDRLNERAVVPQ